MYDAIIIGARCAGAPTAMLLARKGYRVLMLDKNTFPSDTISSHYIHQSGMAHLKRWGLFHKVAALNCPPLTQMTLDVGPFALTGTPPAADEVSTAYCVRRTVMDKILVDAAVEAGAELREGFSVQDILVEDGRVTGIRGRDKNGAAVTEKACIVIGADGKNSLLARKIHAAEYNVMPAQGCSYYSYWSGISIEGPQLYPRDGKFIVATPTNDGLTSITVMWPFNEFHQVRSDIEGHFMQALELAPELLDRVRQGQREERYYGTADLRNFFRRPYGPGWALVGDAGYHRDPISAQGMTNAFQSADMLVEALDNGFSGRRSMGQALAVYELRRNQAVLPMYHITCQMATLAPPPPEMQQLFSALQHNQVETNRYFGTIAGTVSIDEFFAPGNIQRIIDTHAQDDALMLKVA